VGLWIKKDLEKKKVITISLMSEKNEKMLSASRLNSKTEDAKINNN